MRSIQEWLYRPRDVDLREGASLRAQLTVWLVAWLRTPTRYLGVTPDTRLTWSPHVDQAWKKTAQRVGILVPLLNRRSDLSIRNRVLPYKQLIHHMMDCASPSWRSTALTHVRRLQVLQSKCLRLAAVPPWYVSSRNIHKELDVPLFAAHIRALTASFDSKLADVGNPLFRKLGRCLR